MISETDFFEEMETQNQLTNNANFFASVKIDLPEISFEILPKILDELNVKTIVFFNNFEDLRKLLICK